MGRESGGLGVGERFVSAGWRRLDLFSRSVTGFFEERRGVEVSRLGKRKRQVDCLNISLSTVENAQGFYGAHRTRNGDDGV